jgi:hypothetical protein
MEKKLYKLEFDMLEHERLVLVIDLNGGRTEAVGFPVHLHRNTHFRGQLDVSCLANALSTPANVEFGEGGRVDANHLELAIVHRLSRELIATINDSNRMHMNIATASLTTIAIAQRMSAPTHTLSIHEVMTRVTSIG